MFHYGWRIEKTCDFSLWKVKKSPSYSFQSWALTLLFTVMLVLLFYEISILFLIFSDAENRDNRHSRHSVSTTFRPLNRNRSADFPDFFLVQHDQLWLSFNKRKSWENCCMKNSKLLHLERFYQYVWPMGTTRPFLYAQYVLWRVAISNAVVKSCERRSNKPIY